MQAGEQHGAIAHQPHNTCGHGEPHQQGRPGAILQVEGVLRQHTIVTGTRILAQEKQKQDESAKDQQGCLREADFNPGAGDHCGARDQQDQAFQGQGGGAGFIAALLDAGGEVDPERQDQRLYEEKAKTPAPGEIFHEKRADQRTHEGRCAPERGNYRQNAGLMAGGKQDADGDECHGGQPAAAQPLQHPPGQKYGHIACDH